MSLIRSQLLLLLAIALSLPAASNWRELLPRSQSTTPAEVETSAAEETKSSKDVSRVFGAVRPRGPRRQSKAKFLEPRLLQHISVTDLTHLAPPPVSKARHRLLTLHSMRRDNGIGCALLI